MQSRFFFFAVTDKIDCLVHLISVEGLTNSFTYLHDEYVSDTQSDYHNLE